MEINEKLLRQIIEDVLAEMQPSDKSVVLIHEKYEKDREHIGLFGIQRD